MFKDIDELCPKESSQKNIFVYGEKLSILDRNSRILDYIQK